MINKNFLFILLCISAYSYAKGPDDKVFEGSPRLSEFKFKKDDTLKPIFGPKGEIISLDKIDTSQKEQQESGLRAFFLSGSIALLAGALATPGYEVPAHLVGLFFATVCNMFVGNMMFKDRNIVTQVAGGSTGYMTGCVAPLLISRLKKS